GDTAVVTIRGPQELARTSTFDVVESIWTPTELTAVRRMAIGERSLIATDGRRVFGFRREDSTDFAVGVRGAGPGEYRLVSSIAIDSLGETTVVDGMQSRVLTFDADGQGQPDQARPLASQPHWAVRSVATDR